MREFPRFLASIKDEEVIRRIYLQLNHEAMLDLMHTLEYCDEQTKTRWIQQYNIVFQM